MGGSGVWANTGVHMCAFVCVCVCVCVCARMGLLVLVTAPWLHYACTIWPAARHKPCCPARHTQSLAKHSGCFFLNVTASSIMSKWLGDANRLVRAIFSVRRGEGLGRAADRAGRGGELGCAALWVGA